MMNEFKLDFYFEMYKDTTIINRSKFRHKFIKKHGKFQYLPELILMIEKYQIKKYGTTIDGFVDYLVMNKKGKK